MKLLKSLAFGALALLSVSAANAQTKIYITGSSAFRNIVNQQIQNLLVASGTAPTVASTNTALTSANAVTWTGSKIGGINVTIKAAWTGSAAGVQAVASNGGPGGNSVLTKFLADSATGTGNADPNATSNPNPSFETAIADVAMSDTYQATTPFNGTVTHTSSTGTQVTVTYQNLTDELVGVVTFQFIGSFGFPSGQSMTPQLAQYLYGAGKIPLAVWTGASSDRSKIVYATGRNFDSGTRLTTFAETGVGTTSVVRQYQPLTFGSSAPSANPPITNDIVLTQQLYQVTTINLITTGAAGNGGEVSGSTLRTFANKTIDSGIYSQEAVEVPFNSGNFVTATAGYYVTYVGAGDAASVTTNTSGNNFKPAVTLTYNGVDFTTQKVIEGAYTFWGYEHITRRSDLGNGGTGGPAVKGTFYSSLRDAIKGLDATAIAPNVALGDMQVQRTSDGGPVGVLYF